MKTVRIGAGAGYSGDRIEPAVELAERGRLDYLVFECLGERTMALAQSRRRKDPNGGYDPLLEERMRAVLKHCARNKTRIITNMGGANPVAARDVVLGVAREFGLRGLKVAAITGDDLLDTIKGQDLPLIDRPGRVSDIAGGMVAANAYLGADSIAEALAGGADIVLTGRMSDPALFLGPLIHEFDWPRQDWVLLGRGILVGHLLECAGQVTGGYFADPGVKDVAGLARLGFPLAEVGADGDAIITKVEGSGGQVTVATCKEQLLYEVHDPTRYLQPDVVADFSKVTLKSAGPDRVAVSGGSGTAPTGLLKVSIGYLDGYIGEGQMSYAGSGAMDRARLALAIVQERLKITGVETDELRFEMVGVNSVGGRPVPNDHPPPAEVRIRVAGHTATLKEAQRIGNEVETLYTNGPLGGGGSTKSTEEVLAIASALIPREQIATHVTYEVA